MNNAALSHPLLESLLKITGEFSRAMTLEQVAEVVVTHGLALLKAKAAAVTLLNNEGTELEIISSHNMRSDYRQRFQTMPITANNILTTVIRTGEPLWVNDFKLFLDRFPELAEFSARAGLQAAAGLPLIAHGQIIGALGISFAETQTFDTAERDFIAAIANHCAQALDRAQLYRQVSEAREQFKITLSSIGDGVIAVDTDGRITFINDIAISLIGYSAAEALGQPIEDIFHIINESTRQTVENPVFQVFKTGQGVGLANHTILVAKSGAEHPIDDSGAPIRDEQGNIVGAVLVFRDVSERKRIERRQRLLQELTSSLSRSLTSQQVADVIINQALQTVGSHLGTVWILHDEQFLELLSHKGILQAVSENYARVPLSLHAPLTDAIRGNRVLWVETYEDYIAGYPQFAVNIQQQGSQATICIPMYVDQRVIGGISLSFPKPYPYNKEDEAFLVALAQQCAQALDRASLYEKERRARQDAEQANVLKVKFLGMISHELRTPLTSIKGFASTLLSNDVVFSPDEQRDFIEVIDMEADKLTELVEQLLETSRMQAGTLRIVLEPVQFSDILQRAMVQLKALAAQHRLVLEIPQELPLVRADTSRIAQVLSNLVNNAAKFSPSQSEITISAKQSDDHLLVSVSDQGQGIPVQERQVVFEAFRQVGRKEGHMKGAGLGLAICKGIISAHLGRIWVEDTERGTTISFTLPSMPE